VKPAALRFSLAVLLIAGAAVFLQARGYKEVFPPRAPLASFPMRLGPWSGADDAIEKEVLDVLGPGDFLLRDYSVANERVADESMANESVADENQPPVNLYIAYFPSQRAGDTIHSPKNCLPGAGWAPVDSARVTLSLPGHSPFPVTRYIIAKSDARQLVLYWYWAHDRGVASEYWAKFYLVADSMRMNRSDGALVRISTSMYPGETPAAAEHRLLPFAARVVPLLGQYIPR
jgi:EpsI family protein